MAVERLSDTDLINYWIDEAERSSQTISNETARCIAAQLHGSEWPAYTALSTTGALEPDLAGEILEDVHRPHQDAEVVRWLAHLTTYRLEHGPRGPVPHWASYWPEQPRPNRWDSLGNYYEG